MIQQKINGAFYRARGLFNFKLTTAQKKLLNYALRFILGAVFGSARIFGEYAPFGVGFVAASGAGIPGIASLLGVAAGAVGAGGFNWALKYTAIAVIIFAASTVFRGSEFAERSWFAPVNAAFMTACIGFVYAARDNWTLGATAYYVTEVVLAAGCAFFYQTVLLGGNAAADNLPKTLRAAEPAVRRRVSLLIFLATLFAAFAPIRVAGLISPGRVIAVILVMSAGYKGGMAWGCASGVAFGAALDAAAGGEPFFVAAYALAGLIAGVFCKSSRLIFTAVYILTNAAAALWNWSNPSSDAVLYETFAASVIFMLIPGSMLKTWKDRFLGGEAAETGASFAARYAKQRTEAAAAAFDEVYDILKQNVEGGRNDNDAATVFDVASDTVCRGCGRSGQCWHKNYNDTFGIMNDVTPLMLAKGELAADDFPMRFRDTCIDLRNYVASVNTELKAMLMRRQYRARLSDRKESLYSRFKDLSNVLYGVAETFPADAESDERAALTESKINAFLTASAIDARAAVFADTGKRIRAEITGDIRSLRRLSDWTIRISEAAECRLSHSGDGDDAVYLVETEPLKATIGVASLRKRGEDISGDNGAFFKTDDGFLCVTLSDGMGSGDGASRDSQTATRVLERFLKAGVEPQTALHILSAIMTMRGEELGGCATIDLLRVDLWNGNAEIYKFGAAPSYIKEGSVVRRVCGESLSAGLGEEIPDRAELRLNPGSFAVIVSDGVTGTGDDWLSRYLAAYDYTGEDFAKMLARDVVEAAAKQYGAEDDMTCLVVRTFANDSR
ncbi:MAG: SpoIIE family protein phosphatase [Oscillospiraceae bacterium]|nr:SpoIIE family protein phosphatase [Oscillospiraceae bacterium]